MSGEGVRIYGYVFDASSGERLFGATLFETSFGVGVVSNKYGFYSLDISKGEIQLHLQYLGYNSQKHALQIQADSSINFYLTPKDYYLETIVVSSDILEEKVASTESGKSEFTMEFMQKMPALAGEADLIKYIQILPGVKTLGEGNSGYYVRGGNFDQNLILLDEAPVYNPSHVLGFFSVFNPDAIRDIKFYKNHMNARYGGRLSSLLDVSMKEGNNKKMHASGGIGLISSRLTLQGPIVKEKSSFLLTARRTYADLIWQTFSSDESTKNTSIYFYDFTAKMNFILSNENTLFLSGFFGQDINKIETQQYGINWGNRTGTFRWNHVYSTNLFSNVSLIYSNYNYNLELDGRNQRIDWNSRIEDLTLKMEYDWYLNSRNYLQFGLQSTYHDISPGETIIPEAQQLNLSKANALEHAIYLSDEITISDPFKIDFWAEIQHFPKYG